MMNQTRQGDSNPIAYVIACIGGAVGGLLGSHVAVVIGAIVPCLIYQLGIDPKLYEPVGTPQGQRGMWRFGTALVASMVPGFVGWIVGAVVMGVVHGAW